eukprot:TRINITY_DN3047_c0_g3_i1.p1 TRINITY_DN3047_c0_g3~~TRINITY_DN3047_c0_g3_i1.p1  ORF type:complete len:158 (+),score=20.07 TRINITY_DN3047_c0_g3_i1:147-620(+)
MGKKQIILWQTIVTLDTLVLFAFSGLFWWYLKGAIDEKSTSSIAISVCSGCFLVALSVLGFVASAMKKDRALIMFAGCMVVLFAFTIAQLILAIVSQNQGCTNTSNPFQAACGVGFTSFYVILGILLGVSLVGAVFAIVLRWAVLKYEEKEDGGNYY